MSKLMNNREMELFRMAMCLEQEICTLSTGGSTLSTTKAAEKIASRLSFKIDPDDIAECIEECKGSV